MVCEKVEVNENASCYIMEQGFNRWKVKTNEEVAYNCTMDWTWSEEWRKDNNRRKRGKKLKNE